MGKNASDYILRVTAGPTYDPSTHSIVAVNTGRATHVESEHIDADVTVSIQNYHGLPHESPETSKYFSEAPHEKDLYSIAFNFRLKEDINGNEIVWGNDFDEKIKHIPPGINTALRIVRWGIDPGLDGDVYSDKPYLYGPLLSSINVLRVGGKDDEAGDSIGNSDQSAFEEGASGSGEEVRQGQKMPDASAARKKHFLTESNREGFTFEKGRSYGCDFFNPYIDFNEFALKLPGFSLGVMRFWEGQPLRYTLKHRKPDGSVDEPLMAIQITLVHIDEVEEEAQKWGDDGETAKQASAQLKEAGERRRKSFGESSKGNNDGGYDDGGVD